MKFGKEFKCKILGLALIVLSHFVMYFLNNILVFIFILALGLTLLDVEIDDDADYEPDEYEDKFYDNEHL